MSVSQRKLSEWQAAGSLRYLAHHFGVTGKQAARYWDYGWIPGAYRRRRRGHRLVRYTDQTVAHVAARVAAEKEARKVLRYGASTVPAWLSGREVLWEAKRLRAHVLALQGVNVRDLAAEEEALGMLPLEWLIESGAAREFRTRARGAWKQILSRLRSGETKSGACVEAVWCLVRPLLHQPDLEAFARTFNEAAELTWRDAQPESAASRAVAAHVLASPHLFLLEAALAELPRTGRNPSVGALAEILGVSRRSLYRSYGATLLRKKLRFATSHTQGC